MSDEIKTPAAEAEISFAQAVEVAIEAIRFEIDAHAMHVRAYLVLGERVPAATRRAVERHDLLLRAIPLLEKLKRVSQKRNDLLPIED